jgi:hypothetical protein
MDWIIKYRFINKHEHNSSLDWNSDGYMDYLFGEPLYKFEFDNEITEEEFSDGESLNLINKNNKSQAKWNITKKLAIIDLKKMRKIKLDGLDKKLQNNK